MGVDVAGSMELGDVRMQLEKSDIVVRVLAFKEVPCVFGFVMAVWAEVTAACRSGVLCTLEREPVMDKFVNTGLVRHGEVPDCQCHGSPVNVFDCCVVELKFVL